MAPDPITSGSKIGRYQIVREIARSNDIVYEAVDPAMGRRVAVKELLLPPNLAGAQRRERIERFYREAKAAGTLTHPNIVTIYEVGEDQGRHYIAMEYLDGHSLRDTLQMQGLVAVPEALRIAIAIGEALHYAHEHGVIHRDVKPDNVHLLPDGRVKLTDFGIARLMFEATLTANGQVFGTPSYMSPEQVAGKNLDARSDLFSLGVMLYEMVAGRKPFSGDSVITITYNIMNVAPSPLTGVPVSVDRIVARAMAKDPALRYRTAAEMVEEMQRARAGFSTRPAPQAPAALPAPSTGRPGQYLPPPSSPRPGVPAPVAAPNPFAHLQPDDMWFPRRPRPRASLTPKVRAVLGNAALGAVVVLILGFLFWSTVTAYQEFMQAGNRKRASEIAAQANRAYNARQFPRAAELFHSAWELDPRPPIGPVARENAAVAAISEGVRRERAGQTAEAARWYYRATRYDPRYPASYAYLATLAYSRGDLSRADQYWQRAIELGRRRVASAEPGSRARAEAEQHLERAERDAATAWFNRGELLWRSNRAAAARDAWTRAIHYAPGTEIAVQAQQRLNIYGAVWGGGI